MGRTKRQTHIVRLFALALAFLLVAGVLPVRASALSGTTGGLRWSLSAGTLTVSGSGAMPNYTDANMPPWYDSASAVTRIVVGEGVTSVGSLAFYGCEKAQRATLPSTVTAIGDRAFKNCKALTWVNLPEGLESIGDAAFESCGVLNGILLPKSLKSIGSYAFERCASLSTVVIPSGVTELGMVVFYHCTGLVRAEILCPIEKLPDWFFYGCTALAEVYIPKTVTETGDDAFHDCGNLSVVHYSGAAAGEIEDAVHADTGTRFAEVVENDRDAESEPAGDTSGEGASAETGTAGNAGTTTSATMDPETGSTTTVTVTQTEEAVITETTETDYTYTVDGEEATFTEALEATEDEEKTVEVTTDTQTSITATVSGSDGWETVTDTTKEATVQRSDNSGVEVTVQLTGETVNGTDLAGLAGVDAKVTVVTSTGCVWSVEADKQSSVGFGREEIDLSYTVELHEDAVKGIEGGTVYQVNFASAVRFDTSVGIPLRVSGARQAATIYKKTSSGVEEIASAVVDDNGYAWFALSEVDPGADYFVAVNSDNVNELNAVLPDSMLEEYGVDYVQTLTDASGKQYEVGERESRWGITGKQFTIYVLIAVVAIVFIVTGLMITLNRISRSKAKYAAMAEEEDDYVIDEEELRLQIMQEMLEESRRTDEK